MNLEMIKELFMQDVGCGQIVAGEFAKETGLPREILWKMTGCYDGGMLRGETCGAVIAAYNVIGLIAGHDGPNQAEQKGRMFSLELRYNELLQERRNNAGYICKEILGADISTKEGAELIIQGGRMFEICPRFIMDSIECLKQAIGEMDKE